MRQLRPEDIVGILGAWSAGKAPLYRELEQALRDAIRTRQIPAGTRLPAERELARLIAVSRTTVASAYGNLKQDGWLESREGSRTRVRAADVLAGSNEVFEASAARLPFSSDVGALLVPDQDVVRLTNSAFRGFDDLDMSTTFLPMADLAELMDASVGYHPVGLASLRNALAVWLTAHGLPTHRDQLLVTNGAQQAITLLVDLYVRPGEAVALEDPTYFGAIDAFRLAEARMLPIPPGKGGLDVTRLAAHLEARPALAYLVLTHHNPTGRIASDGIRREVARLAEETGIPIVDDLAFLAHSLRGLSPPAPLAAYTQAENVITVGSLSKVFWAGLRIGWIRATPELVLRLARLRVVRDLGGSLPSQLLARRLLDVGDQIELGRRRQLQERYVALTAALARHLPEWTYDEPQGGPFLWLKLPYGDAFELGQLAVRHRVMITPGHTLSVSGSHADRVRLSFVEEPRTIWLGVERLAAAWRSYVASSAVRQAGNLADGAISP